MWMSRGAVRRGRSLRQLQVGSSCDLAESRSAAVCVFAVINIYLVGVAAAATLVWVDGCWVVQEVVSDGR